MVSSVKSWFFFTPIHGCGCTYFLRVEMIFHVKFLSFFAGTIKISRANRKFPQEEHFFMEKIFFLYHILNKKKPNFLLRPKNWTFFIRHHFFFSKKKMKKNHFFFSSTKKLVFFSTPTFFCGGGGGWGRAPSKIPKRLGGFAAVRPHKLQNFRGNP